MAPGIQKLNIPKTTTTSPKAAIANNLRTTTLSSGTSYGIFAQRSKIGSGKHLNNKELGSPSISATRHALNDNRVILNNNIGNFHRCHNNGNNTMNKFAVATMTMDLIAKISAQTADAIKGAKSASTTDNTNIKKDITNTAWEKQFGNDKLPLTSELKNATSFKGINSTEDKINNNLNNFQTSYSEGVTSTTTAITNALNSEVQTTLTDLGITIDTNKIKASTLNINVDDLSTLDTASQTIDKDIQTATKFLNTDITQAISKLESGLGEANANLTSLEQQKSSILAKPEDMRTTEEKQFLQEYDTKHQALQDKKDKIQNALDAMNGQNGVKSLVTDLITTLNDKKAELADIKQAKADMADKKYQVAEKLQKDITTTQRQMDSLESKISKAKTAEDKNSLIKEFNGLVQKMAGFNAEVKLAGSDPIKNSKGKSINLSAIAEKYLTPKTETPGSTPPPKTTNPTGTLQGWTTYGNIQPKPQSPNIAANIDDCKVGEGVQVGDKVYIKQADNNFMGEDSYLTYTADQLKAMQPYVFEQS